MTVKPFSPVRDAVTRDSNFDQNLINLTWKNLSYRALVDKKQINSEKKIDSPNSNTSEDQFTSQILGSRDISEDSGPESPEQKGCCGKVKVWKTLLHPCTGTARPGRTLALMGPSGAGKTTLMMALAGRLRIAPGSLELSGTAFLNDEVYKEKYRELISLVAQDDIVMGTDTPREALNFAYRMKSGADAQEGAKKVDAMLSLLSLERAADTLVGIPGLIKGISGGEKKRTNIGSELMHDPAVLFLDEPTTGLDSVNALRVSKLLQDLAHNHKRTIIATIHTPSSTLFKGFDDLMLLADGHVCYHGPREDAPGFFSRAGYPCPPRVNPSEHYMRLLSDESAKRSLWKSWAIECKDPQLVNPSVTTIDLVEAARSNPDPNQQQHLKCLGKRTPFGLQVSLLMRRAFRSLYRNKGGTLGRLAPSIIFGTLFALMYVNLDLDDEGVQDRAGLIYFLVMANLFPAMMNAVTVFPPERAVFIAEQTGGQYNAVMYYLSKIIADLPMSIIAPTIGTLIVYFAVGFVRSASAFFVHLLILILNVQCSSAYGMMFATFIPKLEVAQALVPLMMMPQLFVAGFVANTERLEPAWIWLTYISMPRYVYKGLMDNEFGRIPSIGPCAGVNGTCRFNTGDEVLAYYGFEGTSSKWWFCAIILVIYAVVMRTLGAIGLYWQGQKAKARVVFEENYHKEPKGVELMARSESTRLLPHHALTADSRENSDLLSDVTSGIEL